MSAPDLPELERQELRRTTATDSMTLSGALVQSPRDAVRAARLRVRESELRGVTFEAEGAPGLELIDVVLRDCALSNVDAREGVIRRVEVHRSQLVGFGLNEGEARDLRVLDSSLELASFASAQLNGVIFEGVNLTDASFMAARLESVEFIGCQLTGADFRGARLKGCAIRGSSLDDVLGIESLRGLRMPWGDLLASAGALAAALGIAVEIEQQSG
ncbi:MAG: pentapeptide repeat-containing protein [Solirubrobacteraceae bacterium]